MRQARLASVDERIRFTIVSSASPADAGQRRMDVVQKRSNYCSQHPSNERRDNQTNQEKYHVRSRMRNRNASPPISQGDLGCCCGRRKQRGNKRHDVNLRVGSLTDRQPVGTNASDSSCSNDIASDVVDFCCPSPDCKMDCNQCRRTKSHAYVKQNLISPVSPPTHRRVYSSRIGHSYHPS